MTTLMPRIGDEVVLGVGQKARIAARVVGVGEDVLRLDLRERLPVLPSEVVRSPLLIEFVNDEGFSRLHGRAEGTLGGVARDAFGRLVFAHRGQPQLLRRGAMRTRLELPLTVVGVGDVAQRPRRATAVHISGEGLVATGLPEPVHVGATYTFELELPGGERAVSGRFVVEHVDEEGHASATFRKVDEESLGLLRRAALERKAAE